ncbi:dTDP-glucose 4,6-dehydratase, partial [Caldisericum sp.]|uniref:dTDP-glucose 4,6-dehydratase n=1 Tax=Caldisericum sp. TaxID=2499687 RepID=UPI003D1285B9
LVRAYYVTYGMPVLITRSSNNFGPRQYPEKLIPLIIINALQGKPLPVYGDGLNVRDWLYVEDNCSAIDIVLHKGKIGEVYNIGGGNEWKNIDLVNLICEILGELTKKPVEEYKKLITFVKDRPGHDRRYALSTEKIKKELEWSPKKDFREGIGVTIKWFFAKTKSYLYRE